MGSYSDSDHVHLQIPSSSCTIDRKGLDLHMCPCLCCRTSQSRHLQNVPPLRPLWPLPISRHGSDASLPLPTAGTPANNTSTWNRRHITGTNDQTKLGSDDTRSWNLRPHDLMGLRYLEPLYHRMLAEECMEILPGQRYSNR